MKNQSLLKLLFLGLIIFSFSKVNAICFEQDFNKTHLNFPALGYQQITDLLACCTEGNTFCEVISGGDQTCSGTSCFEIEINQ